MLIIPVVQIHHLSIDLACPPGLGLPLKTVRVQGTPTAVIIVTVAVHKSGVETDSLLAPRLATVEGPVHGGPLLLSDWNSPQGSPLLHSEWDSLQRSPLLNSEWDSHQEGHPLQSEWDSLLTPGLVAARDPFQGILLLQGHAPQGIPSLQRASPLHLSEWDSLREVPLLPNDNVLSRGTQILLYGSIHPELRLVRLLLRDPSRGLLPPILILLRGEDKEAEDTSMPAPVKAMIDFILQSFPEATASPAHPSSRSFDLSTSAGVTDAATPSGSLLAWCHAMSDSFSDTQKRFSQRIKDGRVCHSLLPTLHRFERVSNSLTQGKELKANPDILDLLRNKVPDFCYLPISIKEGIAI